MECPKCQSDNIYNLETGYKDLDWKRCKDCLHTFEVSGNWNPDQHVKNLELSDEEKKWLDNTPGELSYNEIVKARREQRIGTPKMMLMLAYKAGGNVYEKELKKLKMI